MSWFTPTLLTPRSALSARRYNKEIVGNLEYLKSHNLRYVEQRNVSNIAVNSATWVNGGLGFLISNFPSNGGLLEVGLKTEIESADFWAAFDVRVNGANYFSSGTTTPLTNGIFRTEPTSARVLGVYFTYVDTLGIALNAGSVFSLELMVKTQGSVTFNLLGNISQFWAKEY
jgi:hypothetical protein